MGRKLSGIPLKLTGRMLSGLPLNLKKKNRTCFMTLVFLAVWKTHILIPVCFFAAFACVEGAFFSASLLKIPGKGWFAILMGASEFCFPPFTFVPLFRFLYFT